MKNEFKRWVLIPNVKGVTKAQTREAEWGCKVLCSGTGERGYDGVMMME